MKANDSVASKFSQELTEHLAPWIDEWAPQHGPVVAVTLLPHGGEQMEHRDVM